MASNREVPPFIFSSDFNISSEGLDLKKLKEIAPDLKKSKIFPESLIAPWFVMWDLTYKCNLKCKYCFNASSRPMADELKEDELLDIAGQIGDMNVFSVCLTGGEPTQKDCFIELAKELKRNNITPNTITNGRDVSEDLIKEMADVFGVVQISLDGSSAQKHDFVRGKGSFKKVVETAKLLNQYVSELHSSFVCTKYNIDDFENTINLAKNLGVKKIRTMPLLYTGRSALDKELAPTKEQYENLLMTIFNFKSPDIEVEWGDPILHMKIGEIFGFLQGIEIMANGDVAISPYLPFTFGNLKRRSLSEVWEDIRLIWWDDRIKRVVERIDTVEDLGNIEGLVPWINKHKEVRDVY
jgi:MoaA/NifB/PqqE/SkfB family radical SAM enzyme